MKSSYSIQVLYGDDIVRSRNELLKIKETNNDKEIITLDANTALLDDILQSLSSNSLFNEHSLVIIENLFTGQKQPNKIDAVVKILKNRLFQCNIVFWESKKIGPRLRTFKTLPNSTLKEFTYPVIIFSFVESLRSGNQTQSLRLLRDALKLSVPEVVFSMIIRQFRLLTALCINAKIPEIQKFQSWQLGKLKHQLSYFDHISLKKAYNTLLDIDYSIKTGKTPYDLTMLLEKFIIGL